MKNKPTLTPEDISTSQNLKRQIRDILHLLIVGGSLLQPNQAWPTPATTEERPTFPVDAIPPPTSPYTPPWISFGSRNWGLRRGRWW